MSDYITNRIEIVLDILNKYDPVGLCKLTSKTEYEPEAIEIAKYDFIRILKLKIKCNRGQYEYRIN
jgi:hypothetical protein